MLIKFFARGKGSGSGPVEYVTKEEDREVSPPEVLRGDPERTTELIDSIDREWRYTSGVISFAEEDAPSESDLEQVMDEFEQTAFAGLEREQYDILWVKHSHTGKGRAELHFVSPRMELRTGKSLNIAPPGWEATFRPLREALNAEKGWGDPDDPKRVRVLQRAPEGSKRLKSRESINEYLQERVAAGQVQNRTGLVEALTEAGLEVPRQGKDYVTALDPDSGDKWRLKGEIYRKDWTYDGQLERAAASQDRGRQEGAGQSQGRAGEDWQGPDGQARIRAAAARTELGERVRKRAADHIERYREAEGRNSPERGHEPQRPSGGSGGPVGELQRGKSPAAADGANLDVRGDGGLSADCPERFRFGLDSAELEHIRAGIHESRENRPGRPDQKTEERAERPDRREHTRTRSAERDRAGRDQRSVRDVPEPSGREGSERPVGVLNHKPGNGAETAGREDRELSHDGTGKTALSRIEQIGSALQRSARAIAARTGAIQGWFGRIEGALRERLGRARAGAEERERGNTRSASALLPDRRQSRSSAGANQRLERAGRTLGRHLAELNRALPELERCAGEFARAVRPTQGRAGQLPRALVGASYELRLRKDRDLERQRRAGRDTDRGMGM
ncbi:hypothetical protein ACQU0X_32845 [Pseudovibrio ascidiaceicola]|uniref:hypothetical protein n=1 Tax=Pseudovibrio ascidiaceicola TaxID=285279 RepID=UPI003D35C407